jgi:hypothetical protein
MHPDQMTPASAARVMRIAMNLRQDYSANDLGAMQQQRQQQGKRPSVVLQHAQHFAAVWPAKA